MFQEQESGLSRVEEHRLLAPKIPRQSIDVFDRDTDRGNYGLPARVVDTLQTYVHLQQTLSGFEDLTFSAEFIAKLPEGFRKKLTQNLYPGIPLSELEIPTTDKVFLTELLTADTLTYALSSSPIEVWATADTKKRLQELGVTIEEGLQQIDYGPLPLEVKQLLIGLMERQEMQVHTILLARERFPEGVPVLNFQSLLSGKREKVVFGSLVDLEAQYKAASEAIDNPLQLLFAQVMDQTQEKKRKTPEVALGDASQLSEPFQDDDDFEEDRNPRLRHLDVEAGAEGIWWELDVYKASAYENIQAIAAYLRPQYEGKTIYEIMNAETREAQQEVLAAFWRRNQSRHINLGEESWIRNDLYLKPDGSLELHHFDDLYNDRGQTVITGNLLDHYQDVAMIDQTIKWIRAEMSAMTEVREAWQANGLSETQLIESTLTIALSQKIDTQTQEEINGLPKWFVDALNQEVRYYGRLPLYYEPEPNLDDMLFSLPMPGLTQSHNLLKAYFVRSQNRLTRYQSLISSPEEMYKQLGLEPTASSDEVKKVYRRIAKETKPIQTDSPNNFDPEVWKAMNERFIKATRAYKALSRHKTGDARITTLGKLSSYFEESF